MLDISDFLKLDIRVGTIVEVKINEKALKKAYVLVIDFGKEIGIKKSSAQITDLYSADDLLNKQVLAVVNLKPKQIANIVSEVLVLGAYTDSGVVLIRPDYLVNNGDKLG